MHLADTKHRECPGPSASDIWLSYAKVESEFNGDLSANGENPDRKTLILHYFWGLA
jgi:hypothetical protein